ncbi:hypothetical protein ACIPWY_26325 [Streptomyces sp. NPDC090032]|uniref:wHTH domain-containing protein n=1 Tax=Streptomyces sp. NPDC090032 TaxID=3365925 RepID=UPI00380795C5
MMCQVRREREGYAHFRCLGLNVTVPALAWPVTAEHVSLCAQETDLSEDEVRTRLGLYSRLFELSLSGTARPE